MNFKKNKSKSARVMVTLIAAAVCISFGVKVSASEMSDANAIRKKCERESKVLELAVKNFGDTKNKSDFSKAQRMMKLGKVKLAQAKYPQAIKQYKNYLKIQHNLYKVLANRYLNLAKKLYDEIAEDLVDHIDDKRVVKYFRIVNQNLSEAKSTLANRHYKQSIGSSRAAKKYAISSYKLVGKKIPNKYKKDFNDSN